MNAPPDAVLDRCAKHVGRVGEVERLGGLSGAGVFRVSGEHGSVVAKSAPAREHAVYDRLRPPLVGAGVRIPRLLDVVKTWLLLDHLPLALPRERWGPDPAVVATMRALHGMPPSLLAGLAPFRPAWDESMHAAAVRVLALSPAAEATLSVVRRAAEPLFAPVSVISGDPNPLNWRLDEVGRPVLLDWERIGLAHPAVDLAILLPGLPSYDEAQAMATAYDAQVVRPVDLLVAKAWTLVEFAAETTPGSDRAGVLAGLAPGLDQWLADLDPLLPRD